MFLINRMLNRVVGVLVVAMTLAVVFGTRFGAPVPPQVAITASPSGKYILAGVERGDLSVRVAATGTVEPVRLIEVSTQLSGMIKAVHVENNAIVKAGQLLAELDASLAPDIAQKVGAIILRRSNSAGVLSTTSSRSSSIITPAMAHDAADVAPEPGALAHSECQVSLEVDDEPSFYGVVPNE
jgi:HlyD family secretion protein